MWRSIARFCSALFALSVLAFLVVQAGCGKNHKETNTGALPGTKAGPVIQPVPNEQPEPKPEDKPTTPEPQTPIEPSFFPGTKAGPIFPKPATQTQPTSQKKKSPTKNNNDNEVFLPPTKSGKIFQQ